MKKLVLLFIVGVSTISFAQDAKVVTTQEEYNYLTTGYKLHLESGADFKSGYELKKIDEIELDDFTIKYSLLKEISSDKNKALSIVVSKKKDKNDKVIYLCMPFNNGELFTKFYTEKSSLGISMMRYLDMSVYAICAKAMDKAVNRPK